MTPALNVAPPQIADSGNDTPYRSRVLLVPTVAGGTEGQAPDGTHPPREPGTALAEMPGNGDTVLERL